MSITSLSFSSTWNSHMCASGASTVCTLHLGLHCSQRMLLRLGNELVAYGHVSREKCWRVDSRSGTITKVESINPDVLPYINRWSRILFILPRTVNKKRRVLEKQWFRAK